MRKSRTVVFCELYFDIFFLFLTETPDVFGKIVEKLFGFLSFF